MWTDVDDSEGIISVHVRWHPRKIAASGEGMDGDDDVDLWDAHASCQRGTSWLTNYKYSWGS